MGITMGSASWGRITPTFPAQPHMDSAPCWCPKLQPGPPPARLEGLTTAAEGWAAPCPDARRSPVACLVSQHPVSVGPWASWPGLRSVSLSLSILGLGPRPVCPWVPGRPGFGPQPGVPGSLGALAWAPRVPMAGVGSTRGLALSTRPFTRSSSTGGHTVHSILTRPWWAPRQGQRQTCLLRGGG